MAPDERQPLQEVPLDGFAPLVVSLAASLNRVREQL
jgi:hypothetical protein